jgi:hypothetical protein
MKRSSELPTEFTAMYSEYGKPTYEISLQNGTISHSDTHFDSSGALDPIYTDVTPTTAQWQNFRGALDSLKIWGWQPDYPNTGWADGPVWSLTLIYPDASIRTQGDNNLPNADGSPTNNPNGSPTFQTYLSAIQALLGGLPFG